MILKFLILISIDHYYLKFSISITSLSILKFILTTPKINYL